MAAAGAARYLCGYLMGRSRKKGTVRDNLGDPRMPRLLVYVARSLTRETLVTMRRLRYVRWYFAALKHRCEVMPRIWPDDELVNIARVAARLDRANGPPG